MKKILFAFALVGMFGFAACDKKADEPAKPADKPADKGAMKPADSAAKPATPADSAAKPADTAAGSIGVPECDEYVTKYAKCIDSKMPEAGREQAKASVKQMQDAWKQAASTPEGKSALAQGCKQALDAAKQATSSLGCEW